MTTIIILVLVNFLVNYQDMESLELVKKRKRSATKYWVEIKGRLYARLQYKNEAGIYKVKYRSITDKRTARAVVEKLRNELAIHGEAAFLAEKMTFDELVTRFEENELVAASFQNGVKLNGRRSIAPVRSSIKPLRAYFGNKHIRSIRPANIKAYKNERIATPVETEVKEKREIIDKDTGKKRIFIHKVIRKRERKIASINRELATLRTILNFGLANDWLINNPFAKVKGIISTAAEVERDRVLSFEEEQRLLDACSNERAHIKPIIVCALDTAMRRGEIFKMRWKDIDFVKGQIHIPLTNTKTEESRIVGITPRLRRELENLWETSLKDKNQTVFGISNTIKNAFKSACNNAGVENFRFHDCRHTATTRMIASGSPHTEVMKITGHSQISTFLRYLNITQQTATNVAARLGCYMEEQFTNVYTGSETLN
jgi:integrase